MQRFEHNIKQEGLAVASIAWDVVV